MSTPVITSTGLWTPAQSVSNDELVSSFNAWADRYNESNAAAIARGEIEPEHHSDVDFIVKASGIKSRYVVAKEGVIDPQIMRPVIPERPNDQISIMAEIGVKAAEQALESAGRSAKDVDAVICAASNMQRAYPAMAIEIQQALGMDGFAYDMNVACSSATFGIQTACDYIRAGSARSVLVINPEITSGHLNWTDRDSHFIFGDVATATLIEAEDMSSTGWTILGTKLKTVFSSNIRNNFGFLNRTAPEGVGAKDKLFLQEGRKVFKEVTPMVSDMIVDHLGELGYSAGDLKRLWLHQANANMNRLVAERVLGRTPTEEENPIILDEYANTSSAGVIIAFHKHNADFAQGEAGLICSFGAGYSAGSILVAKR